MHVFVLCYDGSFYEGVPDDVRKQGPWQGNAAATSMRWGPEYRMALARDGYGEVRARGIQAGGLKKKGQHPCSGVALRARPLAGSGQLGHSHPKGVEDAVARADPSSETSP